MTIDLFGQTALVTGGGCGIGEGCARSLAAAGAFVWVNDLDADQASAVAESIGGRALPGDVAEPGDWLLPAIERGVLHTLIHNAGYDVATRVGETEREVFDRLMRVQLSGPFEITQRLLEPLKRANGAAVIHIASVHAQSTNPETSAYSAAKGGLVAMVKSMAQDMGAFKIRALTVSPGFIDTHLFDAYLDASGDPETTRAFACGLHPLGRIGTPMEVGNLVAFLASPFAEFINATNVVIDGGLSARLF